MSPLPGIQPISYRKLIMTEGRNYLLDASVSTSTFKLNLDIRHTLGNNLSFYNTDKIAVTTKLSLAANGRH